MSNRRGNRRTNPKFAAQATSGLSFNRIPSQSTAEGAVLCATSRFWRIPELVDLVIDNYHIFGPLSRADLVSLARVNKFIGYLALKLLWKEIDTFNHLMRLVPKDLLGRTVSHNEGRKSKRIELLVTASLERYLMYSEFPERVFLSTTDTALRENALPKLLALIERSGQRERHFRRIKHLTIASSLQTTPETILSFFGRDRSIESVSINLYWWTNSPVLTTFFHKHLPQYLPRVKMMHFEGDTTLTSQYLQHTVIPALRELHYIQELGFRVTIQAACELLQNGMAVLSSCQSLELMVVSQGESDHLEEFEHIMHPSAPGETVTSGSIPTTDTNTKRGSDLSEGDNQFSAAVLEHDISKPQIHSLSFEPTSLEHLTDAFRICRENGYPLKLLEIFPAVPAGAELLAVTLTDITQSYLSLEELTYYDPFDEVDSYTISLGWNSTNQVLLPDRLECLGNLSNIQKLDIACVTSVFVTDELILGLRHKFPLIENLVLGPTSRWGDAFTGNLRLVTLYSALKFASTCPKLRVFGIRVDARKASAPTAPEARNDDTILASPLQILDLGASYFDDADYVSSLLRSTTPSLKILSTMVLVEEIGISDEEQNIVIDICRNIGLS
ncbi:hypothetical protein FRC14_004758 [Serendipita sp. 396]|nr:hypothetical protein FRC14_004758 [Serendipita sp. 396]KAG8789361.1 hypothetical protein FRC15_009413 [Serendipita sp. 397]KAG8804594.1 hypothetical protein FRC16_006036 [Serendipita sp. 398]KAG8878715.1 hypothetical protein FRC20_006392 [Serendipita sp. 405]